MKRYILLCFLLIYYFNTAFSQYDYYKTYTSNFNVRFEIVQLLETYNETTVASGNSLTALNKQGQVNWSKRIYQDSTLTPLSLSIHYNGLAATPDGGFIGIGGPIVTKFDSLGNQIWSKLFDRPNEGIRFKRILRTSNDEYIILLRSYTPPAGVLNSEWLKMDGNGNVIWHKCYQTPNTGFYTEYVKENSLGFIITQLDGNVFQTDFNGDIIWIRNHDMRVKNIFTVGNNDYILTGFVPGYSDQVWMRVSNLGTIIWTKILPNNLGWSSAVHFLESYKQLSDENLLDIRAVPSISSPNAADILVSKLNVQNGEILWGKRYSPSMQIQFHSYIKDYSVITDSTFNMFPITNSAQGSNTYSHYMRINIGYNPDTAAGCPIQNVSLLQAYNTTLNGSTLQPIAINSPFTIQDITLYSIDVPLTDNVECSNGIAANFTVSNHLLCVDECLSIIDTSVGDITNWEWTFFGTDTTYHYTKYPPLLCYPDSGKFSIQLVVSNSYLSDTLRKTVKVFQLPEIDLGQDTTFCQGEFILPLFQIPHANFSWNDGSTTPYLFINSNGTYTVEVTAATCVERDTIVVNVLDKPILDLGTDTALCFIDSIVLDATILNGIYTYLWQDNSTASQFSVTSSGLYSVSITDTSDCSNTDDILVILNNFSIDLGNDTTLCQGEILNLNATTPNGIYLWNNGSTDSVLVVNSSGIYNVEVSVNSCTKRDTISVLVHDLPLVDLGNDTIFCNENGVDLIPNTSNNVNYLWQNNATTPNFFINNSGIYTLTVTDISTNCQASDTVEIQFIQNNNLDLGNDTILCDGQILNLNATTPNANYLWNDGSQLNELTVNSSGLYIVEVSVASCFVMDSIHVAVISPMELDLGADDLLCNDETRFLNAVDTNAISYLWQDNSTLSTMEINQAGTYFVTVFYNQNCQVSDTVIFTAEGEIYPTLPNDTIICEDNHVTLNAYQPNAISYEWETVEAYYNQHNLQDSVIIATLPGEYNVTISNECRAFTQTITIAEKDCGCYPYVPNAFSPNNDGINDFFEVYTNCLLSNYNLKIFDRWGGILFETDDVNEGWEGTKQGKVVRNGVYVWVLTYESPNERGILETFVQSGSVTLMR